MAAAAPTSRRCWRRPTRHRPDIVVVLTDLDGPARFRPRWPVIWAVPEAHAAGGRAVRPQAGAALSSVLPPSQACAIVAAMHSLQPVGTQLREWRQRRRMSQLDLAGHAEVSTRHLSFMETGRSLPSREMLLRLADRLEVPLRERNRLLTAAGYAPMYAERRLDGPGAAGAARTRWSGCCRPTSPAPHWWSTGTGTWWRTTASCRCCWTACPTRCWRRR